MKIILTGEERFQIFLDSLCNFGGYLPSYYGIEIDYDQEAYDNAKQNLLNATPHFAFEDVLMQILQDGGELRLIDLEDDDEVLGTVTFADLEKVDNAPSQRIINMLDSGDAEDADVVLQTVFLGEVVYG